MVYESDFYTTRRPYRPSTYSVSPLHVRYVPSVPRMHTVTSYYPYGTSRLVGAPRTRIITSASPPHHLITVRVRPDIIMRELDRIAHRHRNAVAYSPSEDFLRSETSKAWEDESRRIRADSNSLMQRIRSSVPRASSVVPYSTLATYSELLPVRLTSEDYLSRLLLPLRNVASDIRSMSWYAEPARKFTGRGHLACIRYSGNKGFPNRKSLYSDLSVKDDVNLLSFYAKNRLAAAGLSLDSVTVKLLPWRASRKFGKPEIMEDPALELKAAKAERLERFHAGETAKGSSADSDALADRKKKRQEEAQQAEERALLEEQARKKEAAKREAESRAAELERQEQLAAQAAAERQAEMDRKAELARQAEEEAEAERQAEEEALLAEEARLADEANKAEEARLAEEAKIAEARLAEEARFAEEDRLAEEMRQTELARLAELERQAQDEREAELARQAAELAELARQESELAAAARQEAEAAELARQEAELAELERQEAELAELERQEAELAAQSADPALAPESADAEDASPVVEEPVSAAAADADDAGAASDDAAEPDLTDEE